jgi:hypothetical protein
MCDTDSSMAAPSPLPALPDRAMMTSDELDWLVYSYLEEVEEGLLEEADEVTWGHDVVHDGVPRRFVVVVVGHPLRCPRCQTAP